MRRKVRIGRKDRPLIVCFLSILFVIGAPALLFPAATEAEDQVDQMLDLDFQDLVQIKITSVNKSEQKLFDAAAAIFVLTQEDIRRSGALNIPDLLRSVPGMHVGQSGNSDWAISARGFQDRFATKMLVMVDGRSVYSIGFGGVYWEHIDVPLRDIQRIEVIRGPGGSVWGSNAVNGVVNIITKTASNSQGWSIETGSGNEQEGFGYVRYGGKIGKATDYRLFAKTSKIDSVALDSDPIDLDDWYRSSGGVRLDSEISEQSTLTMQAEALKFDGDLILQTLDFSVAGQPGAVGTVPTKFDRETNAASFLTRYVYKPSKASEWIVQGYIDFFDTELGIADEKSTQYDLDIQHNVTYSDSIAFSYGANARLYDSEIQGEFLTVDPDQEDFLFVDGFLNGEFAVSNSLDFTVGSKVGHNDYTGVEVQPSARATWKPDTDHRVWAALSRAVRVPDRQNNGVTFNNQFVPFEPQSGFPLITTIEGNSDLDAEVLMAYELGYRAQVHPSLVADLALFYNVYEDVITINQGTPGPTMNPIPALSVPLEQRNDGELDIYGGELLLTAELLDSWRLIGSYSYLTTSIDYPANTQSVIGAAGSGSFHENMANLRSLLTLSEEVELDATVRYMDSLPDKAISSYVAFDLRVGWHLSENVEMSFVGQNIFDGEHQENVPATVFPTVGIERSFYWKLNVDL